MTGTRYLNILESDGTAVPVGNDGDALLTPSSDVEAAATIDLQLLETQGVLTMTFEVGSRSGSHLFAVDFSIVLDSLIAKYQTQDGNFPDPEDAIRSLELLARRLELEASLLRTKVANSIFFSPDQS
jgi:hypothetical protein